MADLTLNQEQVAALVESSEQFPVDFEYAWQWLGYARKDSALRTLKTEFQKGAEFSTLSCKNPLGGRPSVSYHLTNDCFKMLAMMAGTDKGREVRKYYLECERQLKQGAVTNIQPQQIDWQAITKLRHQIENTAPGALRTMLEQAAAQLLGQDYESALRITREYAEPIALPQAAPGLSPEVTFEEAIDIFLNLSGYVAVTGNDRDFTHSSLLYEAYRRWLVEEQVYDKNLAGRSYISFTRVLSIRLNKIVPHHRVIRRGGGKGHTCIALN
jgi:phage anti-repressor protein